MYRDNLIYAHGDCELNGYIVYDGTRTMPRPAILVIHDWSGRDRIFCERSDLLAQRGYVAFALDMYGGGRLGSTTDEKALLMQPFLADRGLLRGRVRAGLDALASMPQVDPTRIAVIGYCFGGLCALDLARSGADIKGVVSFHGLLAKPQNLASEQIKAKILALHGYDDPLVKPEHVEEFCQEMTEAKVDWQVHMYGLVKHAFTNPEAYDEHLGLIYNSEADERSWRAMNYFLEEIFQY